MKSTLVEVGNFLKSSKFKKGVLYINSEANSNVVVMATDTGDKLEGVSVYVHPDGVIFKLGDTGWNGDAFTEFNGKIILEN